MARALLGAAAGAGGATAYYSLPDLQSHIRAVLSVPVRPGPSSSGEVEGLRRLVEQLSRDIRRGQAVTIVHPNGSSTGSRGLLLLLLVAAAGGYCKLRGWSLSDALYVSRGSLKMVEKELRQSVDGLGVKIANLRASLLEKITALTGKQDATIAAQKALKAQMDNVGLDVEGARRQVNEVHEAVRSLEGNVQYANKGIYVLCKVIGEILSGKGTNSTRGAGAVRELDEYLRTPPVLMDKAATAPPAGLRDIHLLGEDGGVEASHAIRRLSSGFMLGGEGSGKGGSVGV